MTDPKEPQHRQPAFDRDEGKFGQGYMLDEERRLGAANPSGAVAPHPSRVPLGDGTMPPENGRRASFDPDTGEVHGSGSGAGGGSPGEDFDEDAGGDAAVTPEP